MEVTKSSIGLTIALVAILSWTWSVLNWVWFKPKRLEKYLRQQGFHGNSYKILHGDLKESSKMVMEAQSKPINVSGDVVSRIFPFMDHTIKKYGKNSFIWMGPTPRVNILDPDMLKGIFSNIDAVHRPHVSPVVKLVATGLTMYEGEQWAKHRKILDPAFHIDKLKLMTPAFQFCCDQMLKEWEGLLGTDGSCELELMHHVQKMAGDVLSRAAFGGGFEEGRKIIKLLGELSNLASQVMASTNIPGWSYLPTKTNRRMKEIDTEMQLVLRKIIDTREKLMKSGEPTNNDLLGLLMESNFREINEHGNDKKKGMSIKEVIEECKVFYFAGQETTSVWLVWTMVLLSEHQEWQARAREEVLQVFGTDMPSYDRLNQLKIVTMILNEVLRLYPPVAHLFKHVQKEVTLGKFTLPAGVELNLPTIMVHQDPELWGEDAKEFNPERFSEGVANAAKINHQLAFFPFAWGPRTCIGMNFAMTEARITLAMILQRFSFELSPSYTHAPHFVMTLHPQHGTHVILRKL